MSILNITYQNFGKGKYELHKGKYEQPKIDAYIDKYERLYLIKLFGVELFEEFVADLVAGVPQSQRFIDVFNPFQYDDSTCDIVISDGMVEMIKGFVYYQYLKDQDNQVHVAGIVRPTGENSENVSTLNMQIYTRYNDSIRIFKAIQRFMCDNSTEYSNFNGKRLMTAYWL